MDILGIDPGLTGAFVLLRHDSTTEMAFDKMPVVDKEICFDSVVKILKNAPNARVFLERAMPLAMGAKHAFNYGRGFMALEIAIKISGLSVTYVEPTKWTKAMHDGISADLKPKAKSIIAVKRLFPNLVTGIPVTKTGKLHEGIVDALLIAGYGARLLNKGSSVSPEDF